MNTKTILVTGARSLAALDLARTFHQAGMRVVCVDSVDRTLCSYSEAVACYRKTASPRFAFGAFIADLQRIVSEEQIDLLVPTCEEIFYIAKAKEQLQTQVFAEVFDKLHLLHHKWEFYRYLRKGGYQTPFTELWDGRARDCKWVLKPVYSRFGAETQIVSGRWPSRQLENANPFIVQAYVEGEKICSYSVCREGRVLAHGAYRPLHTMGIGAAICLKSISDPTVDAFVRSVVADLRFTGQISFDFIRGNELNCIECNPRATSGVHLFQRNPELTRCFLGQESATLYPQVDVIFGEPLFLLWFGLRQGELFTRRFWSHLFQAHSPILLPSDKRVAAAFPLLLFDAAKQTLLRGKSFGQSMSHDMEYNGECV